VPQTELHVFWDTDHVGALAARSNGRVRFTYSREWLAGPALPVSISLPCQVEAHDADASTNFFENFIPEGSIKTELAKSRHIASSDIFSFLREFGKDMAGALSIQEHALQDATLVYEDITERLEDILSKRDTSIPLNLFLLLDANLSLAGGQDKLPVLYQNGRFFLSRGCAPTSHIIKPMHTFLRDLPHNEHFCMTLAKHIGLRVQDADIVTVGGEPVYIIQRFDRTDLNGRLVRLHQEDFCQALSVPAIRKYQAQGGPGWPEMVTVITENPFIRYSRDIAALADVALFNLIIGNTDAHGKNFSLLHHREGGTGHFSLAPFYDICSVHPYREVIKHSRMAMRIGNKLRFDELDVVHWRDFAGVFRLSGEELAKRMDAIAGAVESNVQSVLETHKALYANSNIPRIIADAALRHAAEIKAMAGRL